MKENSEGGQAKLAVSDDIKFEIVNKVIDRGLMGKGAGHVVYKLSKEKDMSIREAGLALANGEYLDEINTLFAKEESSC